MSACVTKTNFSSHTVADNDHDMVEILKQEIEEWKEKYAKATRVSSPAVFFNPHKSFFVLLRIL